MTYDNSNRGQIWRNDKIDPANPDPRTADFTGSMNATCPHCAQSGDYFVDAWKRKPDANPKAAALSFKVKAKNKQPPKDQPTRIDPITSGPSDRIPFAPEHR